MKQSTICKIAVNIRNSFEEDGYKLIMINRKKNTTRDYLYQHKNGHRRIVSLDLSHPSLTIKNEYNKIIAKVE